MLETRWIALFQASINSYNPAILTIYFVLESTIESLLYCHIPKVNRSLLLSLSLYAMIDMDSTYKVHIKFFSKNVIEEKLLVYWYSGWYGGVPDVSAQDVSATRWRKTFRQLFVAETSLVPKRLHSR